MMKRHVESMMIPCAKTTHSWQQISYEEDWMQKSVSEEDFEDEELRMVSIEDFIDVKTEECYNGCQSWIEDSGLQAMDDE